MRVLLMLVLSLLVAAPAARAYEYEGEAGTEVRPTVAQEARAEPVAPALELTEPGEPAQTRAPEARAEAASAPATQEMPRRGSFWWLVGVIVVAGLVLAVLLD